jgi:hypothetical protein
MQNSGGRQEIKEEFCKETRGGKGRNRLKKGRKKVNGAHRVRV